jgi:hypothetical protein
MLSSLPALISEENRIMDTALAVLSVVNALLAAAGICAMPPVTT